MIEPQSLVAALEPYALADLKAPPGKTLISLAQNESCRPPSPLAIEAARHSLASGRLYPDPDWSELRASIAAVHGLDPLLILCGAGSMELIGALMRCYVGPGLEVLAGQYAYAFFRTATLAAGGCYRGVPEKDFTVEVDALLEAVSDNTRVVCLANPGNPTGTRIPNSDVRALRQGLREDILLILDEAYGEFAEEEGSLFDLAEAGNCVVLRTFSKAYGLAGARVGWGLFPPEIALQVRKLLNPNNVSTASQAASAAAMRDQGYMRALCRETAERRERFRTAITRLGLDAVPSSTNFVLIVFPSDAAAGAAHEALYSEGIVMRPMGGYGLKNCLRATIAGEAEMDAAVSVLSRHLEEARP